MPRPNRIKQLRLERKLSQVALARLIGVSNSTISDIENHRKNINSAERAKLTKIFGLRNQEEIYRKDG